MQFPTIRPRRLRRSAALRRLVRETAVSVSDLVYPLFVTHGKDIKQPIASMPGVYQMSPEHILQEGEKCLELGIPAIMLFGLPAYKDEKGSSAYDPQEIVPQAVQLLKRELPELLVMTDVCLCGYTSHGHCGVIENGQVHMILPCHFWHKRRWRMHRQVRIWWRPLI